MLRPSKLASNLLKINGKKFPIPYEGATILATFERNEIPIKFDCRKGQCKSCLVRVRFVDKATDFLETLACVEPAIENMEIDTVGLQDDAQPPTSHETKRMTTRKLKTGQTEVSKAQAKVGRILAQAGDAALDGEWIGCIEFSQELLEIESTFSKEDVKKIFLSGPSRDSLRDFVACLRTSGNAACEKIAVRIRKDILELSSQ